MNVLIHVGGHLTDQFHDEEITPVYVETQPKEFILCSKQTLILSADL